MKYTINLNSELSIDLYVQNGRYAIDDHGLRIADCIKLKFVNNKIVVFFVRTKIASIDLATNEVKQLDIISTMEIKSINEALNRGTGSEEAEPYLVNVAKIEAKAKPVTNPVTTEVHTHFIEMLTGREFLSVLLQFVNRIPVGVDGKLIGYLPDAKDDYTAFDACIDDYVGRSETEKLDKLAEELSLPATGQREFPALSEANVKRNNLITYVARRMMAVSDNPKLTIGNVKKIIYYFLLVESLERLKGFGIKYVEMSYSNVKTIQKILTYGAEKGFPKGIEFKMLFSANRNGISNSPAYYAETLKSLRSLMNKGMVRGFDLMGEENPLSDEEKKFTVPNSFANFIKEALILLNKYPDSVLRLHMGENRRSMTNPLASLELIQKVVDDYKLEIPPPFIRIGHGVFFEKINGDKYAKLLRDLGVVVEINASSNFSLNNIVSIDEVPYNWYKARKIPVVISTDGGGAYLTDPNQEARIAQASGKGTLGYIAESEAKIRR